MLKSTENSVDSFNYMGLFNLDLALYRRVIGVIRTCLKAILFKSFRRFGLDRRQPTFTLNTKNPIKIFRF